MAAGSKRLADAITTAYNARTGDGRLSGTKTKRRAAPAPVFAKVKDVRRGNGGDYVGLVIPQGAWGLLEQKIAPHAIGAHRSTKRGLAGAKTRGRRAALKQGNYPLAGILGANAGAAKYLAGRSKALKLPDGKFAGSVHHPGTTPRHVFHPAAMIAGPVVSHAIADECGKVIRSAYRNAR